MERTKTGIKGLDGILQGGFPRNRSIMVTGGPGSAKTTFGMQYLCKGAREFGEPGVFVTLGETPRVIMEDLASFNFGIQELVEDGKITFLDLSMASGSEKTDINFLRSSLSSNVREVGARRVVIDPITALVINMSNKEIREKLIYFSNLSEELECTTIFTSEMPTGKQVISTFGIEEFTFDGVIILHNMQRGDVRVRGLEVLKMRGTDHGNKIYPLSFTDEGLEVNTEGKIFEEF